MGCTGCTVATNGSPGGCQSKANCANGSCNRLNSFDWLSKLDLYDSEPFDIVEVTFKNGARKGFYRLQDHIRAVTGDTVVVETGNGYDVGRVALSGDLVRLQMKKKKVDDESVIHTVLRRANERDLERLAEAREQEMPTMIRARAIARTLGLEMKVGDVEYQGDKRKATFYYTADGRVDFRELIRHYAKEFRVKIEMRQIGARQESARIGGIGSCGRELCCSTWLTDFKSVSTSAARYQNLAINQAKLSGQCGRLKCCLNYELDTYMEALDALPDNVERLRTTVGTAVLVKTDIFKRIMYYAYEKDKRGGKVFALSIEKVREVKEMNARGEAHSDFALLETAVLFNEPEDEDMDFADVTGEIELPEEKRKKRKKRRKNKGNGNRRGGGNRNQQRNGDSANRDQPNNKGDDKGKSKRSKRHSRNPRNNNNNDPNKK